MTGLRTVEWPALGMILGCYLLWGAALFWLPALSLRLAVPLAAWAIAQHSSLQHEAIHGHPFSAPMLNAALAFPALAQFVPYQRFRDTHLAHHQDATLTDPYDDPESHYLARGDWDGLPGWLRLVLDTNNTLVGRLFIGPIVGRMVWVAADWRAARSGSRRVVHGWLMHLPAVAMVVAVVLLSPMPLWAYLGPSYLGLSLLKIRTFLEHQAHEKARGRTVVIDDRRALALLFLNNNLHVVHHLHPRVPLYRLPRRTAPTRNNI